MVVHNCHRAAARTYREVLRGYGALDGTGAVALGVTATLSRSDRLSLGAVWQSVVEGPTIMDGIRAGWLVRPRGLAVRVEDMDLRKVRIVAGEYRKEDLGEALVQSLAPKRIAEAYREHAADRPGIVFGPTVASAEAIRDALLEAGFTCELVSGMTPKAEREAIIGRYNRGETQILSNCAVFTEGFDAPHTSCVVIARKTRHNGPYIQMAGRGLRVSEGKADCLILDVVGVTREHRLQAQIDLFGDDYGFDREQDEQAQAEEDALEESALEVPAPLEFEVEFGETTTTGVLVADPVDLFHGAAVGWARTTAGAWFLPTRDRFLVVLPTQQPDAWGFDVWSVPKDVTRYWEPVAMARGDLNEARETAQASVTSGERVSQRASWRRADPSPAMVRLAMRMGVAPGFGSWSAGELSAEIDRIQASRRIDPHLPATMFSHVLT